MNHVNEYLGTAFWAEGTTEASMIVQCSEWEWGPRMWVGVAWAD